MESQIQKIATVDMKSQQNGNPIFNIGIFKKEVDKILESEKYINTYLVSEKTNPDKLLLISKPNTDDKEAIKEFNVYGTISLYGDKMSELEEKNGYINIAAVQKTAKEGEPSLKAEEKNELVIFQSIGKAEEKKTVYCGKGLGYTPKSLGLGFLNDTGKGVSYVNSGIDKVKVVFTPDNEYGNIIIGIKQQGETKDGVKMVALYPTTTTDKEALGIIEINKTKALEIPANEKGNINITIADKKADSIQKDKANMNVYENKGKENESSEKNYIGKGWDRIKQEQDQKKNSELKM